MTYPKQHNIPLRKEWFSTDCHKTKTKVITLYTSQSQRTQAICLTNQNSEQIHAASEKCEKTRALRTCHVRGNVVKCKPSVNAYYVWHSCKYSSISNSLIYCIPCFSLSPSPRLAVVMSSRAEAFTQTGWQRNLDVKKILALYHSEENTSS